MNERGKKELTRRERQIMDVLHRRGRATAAEVIQDLADPPSDSAIRTHLRILEARGHVRHEQDGPRYVFMPVVSLKTARKRAVRHLLQTFFAGHLGEAVAALIETSDSPLTADQAAELRRLIDRAKEEGR
jgi:predicted transcriptional regulator